MGRTFGRKLKESYSNINYSNVWDAYDIAMEYLGADGLCEALAKAMGTDALEDNLKYIFRNYEIPFMEDDEFYEGCGRKRRSSKKTKRSMKESNGRDIMDLLTSERVDLMIDLWNDPSVTGGISKVEAMKYFERKGYDCSRYTSEEFDRVWDLACDEFDNRYGYVEEEETSEDDIETKEDAARWLDSKLAEYGNTYHFPNAERYKLDRLIDRFGSTYFWRR